MSRRYQQEQRLELLTETALRMGAKWEKATVQLVLEELAQVSDAEFSACLRQAELECTYAPRPVDFISRCPSLKWQTADEAWAKLDGINSHAATLVLTDLARTAWQEVRNCQGEEAQRKAFCAAYVRLANEWRVSGRKPVWVVSEGNDQARKVAAIREGINQGKLRAADYRALLAPPAEQKTAQPTGPIEKVELSADDIATIEKIMRSEFEPQIRELTHRLGGNAAGKLIAFATRNAPYAPPKPQQIVSAADDDCYELCGRKAELGSSRCAVCGPAARDRAAARARQQEDQNARLARLGC